MKFYLLQWEVAKVKSLMKFNMTLTVLSLQQKRPKGATTMIQVKRIKSDVRIIILLSDSINRLIQYLKWKNVAICNIGLRKKITGTPMSAE